jgi:hypothetical protein
MRPVAVVIEPYEDTGDEFFPEFSDPAIAASLEVDTWNEGESRAVQFKVELKEGRWVIPSHNDYPADAAEHMGKAAASFIGVRKDIVQSDRKEDHAAFSVVDPGEGEGKGEGTGQHIIIKDASGKTLVDVIVGDDVPGKNGYKYIRNSYESRVYASKFTLDVTTDFEDWIEDDLLLVEKDNITELVSDSYKVDEAASKVVNRQPMVARKGKDPRDPDSKPDDWYLHAKVEVPEGKLLDGLAVKRVVGAADRLKIVGVRPRPAMLTFGALQSKGFFVTPDGKRLFGNEGELQLVLSNGVVYTLYFGEVALGTGSELTSGAAAAAAKDAPAEDKKANRYMFVDVLYDAKADQSNQPPAPPPVAEGEPPPAAQPPPKAPEETEGFKQADKLRKRFDKWFYVISEDSFTQMHKDFGEFFKDAPAPTDDASAKPG